MRYITSMERQGRRAMLMYLLTKKFQTVPNKFKNKISEADPEMINLWGDRLINNETLEEIFAN